MALISLRLRNPLFQVVTNSRVLLKRYINTGRGSNQAKPLPRLIYIQNPLIWLSNKLDFRYLRVSWDPKFNEKDFNLGTRQAVSTISHLVNEGKYDDLKLLLTKQGMLTLRRDVEVLWGSELRKNIALRPEDVQLTIPKKLFFRKIKDKKYCDVDVVFIGLKHVDRGDPFPHLALIDIIARFHRDYTHENAGDWSVAVFRVRGFKIMGQKNNM